MRAFKAWSADVSCGRLPVAGKKEQSQHQHPQRPVCMGWQCHCECKCVSMPVPGWLCKLTLLCWLNTRSRIIMMRLRAQLDARVSSKTYPHIISVTQQQYPDRNTRVNCIACCVRHASVVEEQHSHRSCHSCCCNPTRCVPWIPVCVVMSDNTSKTQQQRCCLGLLYYSQALQAEGQKPVRQSTVVVSTDHR